MINLNSVYIPWLVFHADFEYYIQGIDEDYKGLVYYYTSNAFLENSPFEFIKTSIPNFEMLIGDIECDAISNLEYEYGACKSKIFK